MTNTYKMTYQEILQRLEEYHYALNTEDRLVRVGLKAAPEFTAIQSRYSGLFAQEHIQTVKEALGVTVNAKTRERMERTLFALLEGNVAEREMPVVQEIIAIRNRASANVDGQRFGYFELLARLSNEPDFGARERLRAALVGMTAELVPQQQDRERVTRQALAGFGFHSVREYAETKKHIKYETLLKKALPILEETTGLYRRVMSDAIRKEYGRDLGEISAAHVAHWRAGHEFDHLFPADKLLPNCKAAFATMGLDFDRIPAIAIDAEDRPKKNARASCYPAIVPHEVHLILKPKGGYDDVRAFMHEGGHAMHYALTDATLPYEHRQIPRSLALTEIFSFVMERLTENPLWLEHVMKVPKAAADRIANWALLGNLFLLRRYIAKFTYELAFDERPQDGVRNKALYAKTLRDLTGFAYEPELWLEDMDPQFYSADYLRAWIASAQLEEHLTRALGDRWFLKRETGEFLKKLYAKGDSWEAEELVQSLGMQPWDPLPLIRTFDGVAKLLR